VAGTISEEEMNLLPPSSCGEPGITCWNLWFRLHRIMYD